MVKINIDLENPQHVKAAAAFFNTLAGADIRVGARQTKLNFDKPELEQVKTEKSDEELTFGELKAKYPHIKAKSKQNFLTKIKEQETKSEETKSEETKSEETKSEETKSEETKPEETKPEETKPEETKPEETKPEETSSEYDLDSIKAVVAKKVNVGDNTKKLRAKLKEFGAQNVRGLDPKHYPEFMELVNSLPDE